MKKYSVILLIYLLITDFVDAVNNPYKGGYITKHYGDKNKQCESLQIEISYQSYIDKRVFDEEEYPTINNNVMNTWTLS